MSHDIFAVLLIWNAVMAVANLLAAYTAKSWSNVGSAAACTAATWCGVWMLR